MLWGRDEHLFDKESDLVALSSDDTDRLNILLLRYLGWLFKVLFLSQAFAVTAMSESFRDLFRAKRTTMTDCDLKRYMLPTIKFSVPAL